MENHADFTVRELAVIHDRVDCPVFGFTVDTANVAFDLDEPLRPDDLARMAGLSPAQLDRRMRRVFGISTSAFVRKTRIEHAAQLLVTTATPIAEIALACGYGDQTAFTRQFHATVGQPPAAWRENAKRHV